VATSTTVTERPTLVGNRLVLVGSVLYLLEWVAIVAASVDVPLGATSKAPELVSAYAGHADALGWAAGWFSVVLLGRILIMTGLRSALAASGRPQPLMDLAVAAMVVSVVLEIATYAVVAGVSWSVGRGGSTGAVRALDSVAFTLNDMIYGPLGVSLLCAGAAMWVSGLFGRVLPSLALVGGAMGTLLGLAFVSPTFAGVATGLGFAALLLWIWMIWTGVVLWRARPAPARHPPAWSSRS
jgi:hypothetical protein